MSLFEAAFRADLDGAPLAARMRPRRLSEVVGQEHLVGEGSLLSRCVASGRVPSLLLWGPPGTGKTTVAEALSHEVDARFVRVNAVLSGVKEIREAIAEAERARYEHRRQTLLFVDEIHRFNKAQQDALLPHVERGVVTLLGATTENPSFEVNGALLSRCRVVVVKPLDEAALHALLERALTDQERGLGARAFSMDDEARTALVTLAGGDGRRLLTTLEICADLVGNGATRQIELGHVQQAAGRRAPTSDKKGDKHYGVISAFIKSLRGSDPDAACYYLVRMLEAGEDPYFLLRRMVIFASEDVGNADPRALQVATAALHAFELVGLPEGVLPLTQAATFLATCPKSNAVYAAYNAALADVHRWPDEPVPTHLVNAVTALQKQQGTGDGYRYPHDFDDSFVPQQYAPDRLVGRVYYAPKGAGLEKTIVERLQRWRDQSKAARRENGRLP